MSHLSYIPVEFFAWFHTFLALPALRAEEDLVGPTARLVEAARNVVSLLVWLIALFVIVVIAVFVIRKVMHDAELKKIKGVTQDATEKAARFEKKGDFVNAGLMYEKLANTKKAAEMFERGRDFGRAARAYDALGQVEKAVGYYKRAGESLKAAAVYVKAGKYLEAAKIFKNKGDRLRAAQALEMAGQTLAAAKEYAEAGQHLRAARIYKDKGMFAEAGEMFRLSLGGEKPGASNLDKYYAYASFLMMTSEMEKAADIFRGIVQIDSGYRDVTKKLAAIAAHDEKRTMAEEMDPAPQESAGVEFVELDADKTEAEAAGEDDIDALIQSELDRRDGGGAEARGEEAPGESPQPGEATLRNIISSGTMDPSYGMRMWVQILRALSEKHGNNMFFGCLTPETVFIDMQNNIRIEKPAGSSPPYAAPEVLAGSPPDEQADIYPMGAILYELVTGSIHTLEDKAPSSVAADVPEWLDEFIMKCTEKERNYRYQNLEEIYARLLELKEYM